MSQLAESAADTCADFADSLTCADGGVRAAHADAFAERGGRVDGMSGREVTDGTGGSFPYIRNTSRGTAADGDGT